MKIFILLILIQVFNAEQSFAFDICHDSATVAKSEFYVCTQYEQIDKCFQEYVLKNKPINQCDQWQSVCLSTSQVAEISSDICF